MTFEEFDNYCKGINNSSIKAELDMVRIATFADDITHTVLEAAKDNKNKLDVPLLINGLGYFFVKVLKTVFIFNSKKRNDTIDMLCYVLQGMKDNSLEKNNNGKQTD